jgi:hypothetical protein
LNGRMDESALNRDRERALPSGSPCLRAGIDRLTGVCTNVLAIYLQLR